MSTEAAIKIFDPRTVKLGVSGGRASIHWDDIAAMLSTLERENPVGYQMIMVNYRDDKQQEKVLRDNVTKWVRDLCSKSCLPDVPLVERMCQTVVDIQFHRPLSTQQRSLQHLHRLYGPYAQRETTRMKKLKKMLNKEQLKPKPMQRADRISYLEESITAARQQINNWVVAHAMASTHCPRCRGTGVITQPQHGVCPVCNGDRHIAPTHREICRHISSNTSRVEGYWFVMDECRWWLSACATAATTRLHELFEMNRDS
ncbi:hypothetical protein FI178_02010 [Salmonella enterica subsp. enterica]|nr:hypothetical protein [Salmonella enterica subsp. enterica]